MFSGSSGSRHGEVVRMRVCFFSREGAGPEFQSGLSFLPLRHSGIGRLLTSNTDSQRAFGLDIFSPQASKSPAYVFLCS